MDESGTIDPLNIWKEKEKTDKSRCQEQALRKRRGWDQEDRDDRGRGREGEHEGLVLRRENRSACGCDLSLCSPPLLSDLVADLMRNHREVHKGSEFKLTTWAALQTLLQTSCSGSRRPRITAVEGDILKQPKELHPCIVLQPGEADECDKHCGGQAALDGWRGFAGILRVSN